LLFVLLFLENKIEEEQEDEDDLRFEIEIANPLRRCAEAIRDMRFVFIFLHSLTGLR
jgi:hypothetical protein